MIQAGLVESKTSNEQRKGGSEFLNFSKGKTRVMKQVMRIGDEVPTIGKRKDPMGPYPYNLH